MSWAGRLQLSFSLSLFFLLSQGSAAQASSCEHDAKTLRCVRYLRNYDGDTISVHIPGVHPLLGEKIGVRVRGVDTPEIKGRGACEGKSARQVRDLVHSILSKAKRIDLVRVERDKYFRILAEVQVDGESLSQLLLEKNFAVAYHGGRKRNVDWCRMGTAEVNSRSPR